ncbi:MAG: hypothetical protein AB7U98_09485 [Candidatus Nitrosocosmicus sp.]|uniref:hypothetical protein n=1 Tax=Candidatus Nitrosocosmicus sp. FF01 TaxID=3397670 RepID=UPI0039E8075E
MSIKTANTGHEALDYFNDSKRKERPYNAVTTLVKKRNINAIICRIINCLN